jgi:hypothetical protein
MAGVKGKSGRKPLLQEIKRHALINTSYEITQAYLDHKKEPLKEKAQIAVGVVKVDMSKPIVVDQSNHVHMTTIQVENMKPEELVDLAMGRQIGR